MSGLCAEFSAATGWILEEISFANRPVGSSSPSTVAAVVAAGFFFFFFFLFFLLLLLSTLATATNNISLRRSRNEVCGVPNVGRTWFKHRSRVVQKQIQCGQDSASAAGSSVQQKRPRGTTHFENPLVKKLLGSSAHFFFYILLLY
jgi:hypothetical protein